jgi:putative tricarboxylic transport membrane protein
LKEFYWAATAARVAATTLLLAAAVACASAQPAGWRPERPVENVVASAAGGAGDANARLFQSIVQKYRLVDVPIVINNKPGGGQAVALSYMDQHAGDGHYLMNSTMGLMTAYLMGRSKVTYTDYTTLAILYGEYMTLAVKPDSPIKNGRDAMERLKRDPQSLSIAIGLAIGGTNHISVGLVAKAMGIDVKKLKTVVFQTNAQGITATMGGHVDLVSLSLASALRATKAGQVRIIGISAEHRSEGAAADIPTWKEQGLDVVFSNIRFSIGPKGLSATQMAYWDTVFERLQTEEWKNEVQQNDWVLDYANSKQAPQRMVRLNAQLKAALTDAGLVKD